MSEPARKIDPGAGAVPKKPVFDDVSDKFFAKGEEISEEAEKPVLDNEPISSTEGQRERKEEKPGRLDFITKFFKKTGAEADKLKAEADEIKEGKVGAEGTVPITEGEKKAAEDLKQDADRLKADRFKIIKIPLVGDIEDQLDRIREIGKNLTDKEQNPGMELSKEDLNIYKRLTKSGAKYENNQYTEASDEEQKRLRELEGPVITKDVLSKMAAGEIPWTTNGIFAAASLLRAGKSPATGKRFGAGDGQGAKVFDIKTGNLIEGAALAAAAIGAIATSGKAPSPDKEPARADTEPAKIEKNEAEKYIEVMAAEYRTRLDEALEEQTRLTEELANIESDLDILLNGVKDGLSPVKRADAIQKNIALIGKYAKRQDALKTSDPEVSAAIEAMNVNEYLVSVLGAEERVGDSPEYLEKMEGLLASAKQEIEDTKIDLNRRLAEADEKIYTIEKKLAFYSPEEMPPKSLRRRLIEVNSELAYLAEELAKETDPESPHAKELAASIAAKTAEKQKLDKAAEKFKPAPMPAARELSPEEILQKEKDEYAAIIKQITERMAACREKINDLKSEPSPTDRDTRMVALRREMNELEEEGEVMNERFNSLLERIKEAGIAGKEPVERKQLQQIADEAEANATAKTGPEMYRTTKADGHSRPPNPEAETVIKETRKHAEEIIAARKETYIEAIRAGKPSIEGLKTIKNELAALSHEAAVRRILTDSKNKKFKMRNKHLDLVAPFADELYSRIMADTDELIALAESNPAAMTKTELKTGAEPRPKAERMERNRVMDSAEAQNKWVIKQNEALDIYTDEAAMDDVELLETIRASDNADQIEEDLIDHGFLSGGDRGRLDKEDLIELISKFIANYKQLAEHKRIAKSSTATLNIKPDAKGEREAVAKIMEAAREKIKILATELEGKEIGEIRSAGQAIDDAETKDIGARLAEIGCITIEDAAKLGKNELFTLRNEVVALYRKTLDKKRATSAPAAKGAEPKAKEPKKDAEPTVKNEFELLLDKADAILDRYKQEILDDVAGLTDAEDLKDEIEGLRKTAHRIREEATDRATVIEKLTEMKVLEKAELEKLNDAKLKKIIEKRVKSLLAAKDAAVKRLREVEAGGTAATATEPAPRRDTHLAGVAEPPRPPEKEKGGVQDAMSFLAQRAEALERTVDEPGFNLPSYIRTHEALDQPLPPETMRQYLVEAGIDNHGKEISANLSDSELEALRQAEVTHLQNIIDRAKPKKKPAFKSGLGEIAAAHEKNGKDKKKKKKNAAEEDQAIEKAVPMIKEMVRVWNETIGQSDREAATESYQTQIDRDGWRISEPVMKLYRVVSQGDNPSSLYLFPFVKKAKKFYSTDLFDVNKDGDSKELISPAIVQLREPNANINDEIKRLLGGEARISDVFKVVKKGKID